MAKTNTNAKTKTKTKRIEDPRYAIFSKSREFKDTDAEITKINTKTYTKTMTMTKTNTFREQSVTRSLFQFSKRAQEFRFFQSHVRDGNGNFFLSISILVLVLNMGLKERNSRSRLEN